MSTVVREAAEGLVETRKLEDWSVYLFFLPFLIASVWW